MINKFDFIVRLINVNQFVPDINLVEYLLILPIILLIIIFY